MISFTYSTCNVYLCTCICIYAHKYMYSVSVHVRKETSYSTRSAFIWKYRSVSNAPSGHLSWPLMQPPRAVCCESHFCGSVRRCQRMKKNKDESYLEYICAYVHVHFFLYSGTYCTTAKCSTTIGSQNAKARPGSITPGCLSSYI